MNNYRKNKQRATIVDKIIETLINSKMTILVISLAFLLYFLMANSYFLFILGIIGCIYLIFAFPTMSTDNMRTHPYLSGYTESVLKTQQSESRFLFFTAFFEMFKAVIMIILGFGAFIVKF